MEPNRTNKGCCGRLMDMMRCKQRPQHNASSQATDPSETDNQPSSPCETDSQSVIDQLPEKYDGRLHNLSTKPEANEIDIDSADVENATPILPSQGKMALLSEQRKQILRENRVELVERIELHELWSHLRSHKIVTKQNEEWIK
ncbi:hypothetical protein CAPTEDRAFT_198981, partial [Capitella teleta]